MDRVVVYGFSTEGYSIASQMVDRGADVYIVDETTASAVSLKPEIAKTYPDVASLLEDEQLMKMEPVKVAISQARYLFFAPRIRRAGPEAKTEINSKFKDAATHLKEGSSVICNIPTGLGGNAECISLLKHVTGMDVGRQVSYYYYPLEGHSRPGVIGATGGQKDAKLSSLLSEGGEKRFVTISSAERAHAVDILSRFSKLVSTIEVYKHVNDNSSGGYFDANNEVFLDTMIGGLFDLRLISDSQEDIKAVQYLINGSIRGIEGYIKRLVDTIRSTLKENGLKVSRTNIAIAWSLDYHGMRGDKIEAFQSLSSRLRDYTGKVDEYAGLENFHTDKTTLVVACSRSDYDRIKQAQHDDNTIVIKATPLIGG